MWREFSESDFRQPQPFGGWYRSSSHAYTLRLTYEGLIRGLYRLRSWMLLLILAASLSACGRGELSGEGMLAFKEGRYQEAAKLWKKASREGDTVSQFYLGRLYESGIGVKQDYAAAGVYYLGAAKKGHPYAQGSLALLYAYGRGVPLDFVQSYVWSTLAATNYPKWARDERLVAIRNRDIVATRMSASEMLTAQRAIDEFQAATAN